MSKATKLVAAFNHAHIFIDPDPDPAKSFAERERLFRLPALDAGATTTPRSSARAAASSTARPRPSRCRPEMRKLLDLAGGERVRRGGHPPHPDRAGRPALQRRHRHLREGVERGGRRRGRPRQRPRARGRQGGAGAGGGRGRQPRASPSAAASSTADTGGLLNTDAVDNSGGVDMSDHEVNIKILMDHPREEGRREGPRGAQPHPRGDDGGGGRRWSSPTTTTRPAPSPSTPCAACARYEEFVDAHRRHGGGGGPEPRGRRHPHPRGAAGQPAARARPAAAAAGRAARPHQDVGLPDGDGDDVPGERRPASRSSRPTSRAGCASPSPRT